MPRISGWSTPPASLWGSCMVFERRWSSALLCALALGGISCAGEVVRRFPLRDPLWVDPDTSPIANQPAKRERAEYSYMIDQTLLRPLSQTLAVAIAGEAPNVNSLDEVPNSSWFT